MITPADLNDVKEAPFDDPKPPPYTPSIPTSVRPAIPIPPGVPVINHLYITENYKPIEGRWVVDPFRRTPAAAMPKLGKKEVPDNVHLQATYKKADAEFLLLSSEPCQSSLWVKSTYGTVNVTIAARANQCFRLYAASSYETVNVHLPRNFEGTISLSSTYGSFNLSKGIESNMTPVSGTEKKRIIYVGNWDNFTEANGAGTSSWIGDEAVLESTYKKINVAYADEK